MSSPAPGTRPFPLRDAFRSVGTAVAAVGSIVTALVGWGVVSAAQGDAVVGLVGLIPGVVTGVTTVLQAFGVIRKAEGQVTPTSSPAIEVPLPGGGTALVGLVPDPVSLAELGIDAV